MARTRRLDDMRADARKRADCESATDRHPDADVTRYINQGGAALWDLLIEIRGREFCRAATPTSITTTANTTVYNLAADFYTLISVWLNVADDRYPLEPLQTPEEPWLRDADVVDRPTHYELRRDQIAILPVHSAGLTIQVDYVPAWTDLSADGDTANGVNGWEDYIVDYAAQRMAVKDEELGLAQRLDADMAMLAERVRKLAPKRDMFRAKRVRDVRGPRAMRGGGRW
jgi:hypothetical protein